jgi:hypothetical protein
VLWYNQAHGTFWPRSGPPETYAAEPLPGDIVYFHDTYDRNRNRRFDDPFTHVGLVESVDGEGTVTFLHAAGHVVKREKMNLRHPHDTRDAAGNPINHTLRFRTRWEKKEDPRLASELFAGYGRLGRPAFAAEWSPEAAVAVQPHGKSFQKGTRRGGSHRRSKAAPHAPKARGSRR